MLLLLLHISSFPVSVNYCNYELLACSKSVYISGCYERGIIIIFKYFLLFFWKFQKNEICCVECVMGGLSDKYLIETNKKLKFNVFLYGICGIICEILKIWRDLISHWVKNGCVFIQDDSSKLCNNYSKFYDFFNSQKNRMLKIIFITRWLPVYTFVCTRMMSFYMDFEKCV